MNLISPKLGIGLMTAAMLANASKDGIAKFLILSYSPITVAFIQFIGTSLILLPFAIQKNGISSLVPNRILPQVLRSLFLTLASGFFYWSLNFIHVADATAMVFVSPLLVAAFSPFFLGEPIGFRRTIAVIIGFIGVLIILRPTFEGDRTGFFIALVAGFFIAAYFIANRKLSSAAPILVSTFYSSWISIVLLAPLAYFFWTPPSADDMWVLFGFTFFATLGQIFQIGAFSLAAASVVAPFIYTQIIWATIIGYVFFSAFPDKWSWIGIATVVATGVYIAVREIDLKKDK